MKFESQKFLSLLPKSYSLVLSELIAQGYRPVLVGGTVRDYFLFGTIGKDWDIELSHETLAFNGRDWKDLGKSLTKFGRVSFLPYDIIRLDLDVIQMEFSPPRIEHYKEGAKNHSNFEAEFQFKLPFSEGIKRRDFTINAMGVSFITKDKIEFLDPLGGLKDLSDKALRPCGQDFSKDPVRFLRAHRFALKYKFQFSLELKEVLSHMHLEVLTPLYFWNEMQKSSDPVGFLERLREEKKLHPSLKLPLDLDPARLQEIRKTLFDPTSHDSWVISLEWAGVSCESWRNFFSLSSQTTSRMARWAQVTRDFQKHLPESFHGEFEEIKETENFNKLFDWYFTTKQLLQKNPELPLLKMIEDNLPAWIYLYQFELPKDVKHIDPPLRAKYQVWNLCQRL